MQVRSLTTRYAPAERLSKKMMLAQARATPLPTLVQEMIDSVPNLVLVLNKYRQVIFSNRAVELLFSKSEVEAVGLRPGELMGCIHAAESEAGCGTTEFCQLCGAVNAILISQRGEQNTRECRINLNNGASLDLRITASPLQLNGEPYTIFNIIDISHEKRRRILEQLFFHDILNTAGGLRNVSELLKGAAPSELDDLKDLIRQISDLLVDEIMAQRTLSAAENDELTVTPAEVRMREVLEEVVGMYASRELATARALYIDPRSTNPIITTDPALLKRVLGNMVKNALEASRPGETITAGCLLDSELARFWVHNPGAMPREVKLQIFQRSFSTKGSGRGLGTYSIKLLTEHYLHGQAGFTSTLEDGTQFYILLPQALG